MTNIEKQTPDYIKMRMLNVLIKKGMDKKTAIKRIEKNFDFAYRCYGDCFKAMVDCIQSV